MYFIFIYPKEQFDYLVLTLFSSFRMVLCRTIVMSYIDIRDWHFTILVTRMIMVSHLKIGFVC
jgi:hypothetical protein